MLKSDHLVHVVLSCELIIVVSNSTLQSTLFWSDDSESSYLIVRYIDKLLIAMM
jgi:hypothetical protein